MLKIILRRFLVALKDLPICKTADLPEIVIRIEELKRIISDMGFNQDQIAQGLRDVQFLDEVARLLGGNQCQKKFNQE